MNRRIKITEIDLTLLALVEQSDHKVLGIWAADCAERVLHYFESKYSEDDRPQTAIKTLHEWVKTGEFSMSVIRKASLDSHAAARSLIGIDQTAVYVARACGQAVATAHVARHAIGSAQYAVMAIYDATQSEDEVKKEREWQFQHLQELLAKV